MFDGNACLSIVLPAVAQNFVLVFIWQGVSHFVFSFILFLYIVLILCLMRRQNKTRLFFQEKQISSVHAIKNSTGS
jgi:hypothetical protein